MSRRYNAREPVYVQVEGINYGFQTNLTAGDQTALQHKALSTATTPVAFGCGRPKPPRFKKDDGSASSFGDINLTTLGIPDGWTLAKYAKRVPRPRETDKSKLVYVEVGGLKYAWMQPKEVATKIGGDLAALGIQTPTNADKCVLGANLLRNAVVDGFAYTKPPRARKIEIAGVDGTDSISTFFDPSVTLPAGWMPLNE